MTMPSGAMMADAWRRSPQSLDPLGWFTGPLVPLVFGGLAVAFGTGVTLAGIPTPLHWLQWPALACIAAAHILISVLTSPRRAEFTGLRAAVPLGFGWLAALLSGIGYSADPPPIEQWWAPLGLGFVLASLAPYSSAIRMVVLGSLSCLVTAGVVLVTFLPTTSYWSPVSFVIVGVGTVAVATVAGAVFCYQAVARITEWSEQVAPSRLSSGVLGEAAKLRILRREITAVSARALPLLQRVVATGRVSEADRQQAAELAKTLRAELVERSNRSWLDGLAPGLKLTIVDPEHRADRMTPPQRSALLGLLRAAGDGVGEEHPAFVIELRSEMDGATAVALSLDVELPEGRRVTLLSPHYLTLKTTVDELRWDSGETLRMHFRLPPEQ